MTNKEFNVIREDITSQPLPEIEDGLHRMFYGKNYKKILSKMKIEFWNLATFGVKNPHPYKSFIDANKMLKA